MYVILRAIILSGCSLVFIIALCVVVCCRPACCRGKTKQGYILSRSPQVPTQPRQLEVASQITAKEPSAQQTLNFPPNYTLETLQQRYPNEQFGISEVQ